MASRRSRPAGALACVAASLVLSACGSTVPSTGTAAGAGVASGTANGGTANGLGGVAGSSDATGLSGPSGPAGATTTGAAAAVAGTGSGAGGSTGSTVGGGSAPSTAGAGAVAPGVTATTIALGLPYSVNSQTAAQALGASGGGVGGGDGKTQWELLLKDINDHGGILGRKLVPVWHVDDSTDSASTDQKEQQACSDWTQDHKVFAAVVQEASPSETLLNCLSKAGVVQLYEDVTRADAETFRRYPYYVETGTLRMDRVAAFWPQALAAQGYFSGWDTTAGKPGPLPAKVGIVSFDDRTTVNSVERQLEPALKAAGYPAVDWIRIQYPTGEADNANAISAIEGAELKFASEGITHVLPFDAQGAGIGAFFAQGADSQKYYPRYGLNSGNGAQTLVDAGLWPKTQLNGSLGYGWMPLLDLQAGDNPDNGPLSNAARRYCVNLMAKGGEDVSTAIVKRQVISKCDALRFLKQSLELSAAGLSREAFLAGANRLGTGFMSGMTFGTRFDAAHHDGAAYARGFTYTPSCQCFKYVGSPSQIP